MLKEIDARLASCAPNMREQLLLDLVNGQDFRNEQNVREGEAYVAHIISDRLAKNLDLSRIEAKFVFLILAKMSLAKKNLTDVKINILSASGRTSNAGAFYDESKNSVNIFDEYICDKYELLDVGKYRTEKLNAEARIGYLLYQIYTLNHEIEHAGQFAEMKQVSSNPDSMTAEIFEMQMQEVVRLFYGVKGSKYADANGSKRIYSANHDDFLIEIKAELDGAKNTIDLLKKISPVGYAVATNPKTSMLTKRVNDFTLKNQNLAQIEWKNPAGNTNINARKFVCDIISDVLPKISQQQRDFFMSKYVAMQFLYRKDGTMKSKEELENNYEKMLAKTDVHLDVKQQRDRQKQIKDVYNLIGDYYRSMNNENVRK